jgi:universal stress protein A
MINLNRILLPTDFSSYAKTASNYACALAEQFGSELHLLHVVQDLVAMVPEPGLAFPPPGDYMGKLQESAERALDQLLDQDWAKEKDIVKSTRQPPLFLEIIRYAKENEINLIVMGTHGRSGLAHTLLGSVAEKVVRKAPCPVLTVRTDEHQFVMP